jgi:hypothetical protein
LNTQRWIAYAAGVKFGDKSDWGFAWSQFTRARVPSEKSLWMRALALARDPYVLQRYLGASLERDMIRPQDVTSVLSGVAHNHAGSQLAWRHLRMNWDFLVSQFGAGSFIMGSLIDATTSHFSSEFDYQEVN